MEALQPPRVPASRREARRLPSVATGKPAETGIVSHVDDRWVYVHYSGSQGPLATHPANLRLTGERR
ncbi:hypothetical protein GS498_09635 [Rhodococcus hoagii]|nr:hypothetical protein [Prescottella equi]